MGFYDRQVYQGKLMVEYRKKQVVIAIEELSHAEQLLIDYVSWWDRFMNFCHTGK